jgi:hypothetical protein
MMMISAVSRVGDGGANQARGPLAQSPEALPHGRQPPLVQAPERNRCSWRMRIAKDTNQAADAPITRTGEMFSVTTIS